MTDIQICELKHVVEIASAIFGIVAALVWFKAAWWAWFPFKDTGLDDIQRYSKWQAICNGIAAFCAAVAALMQLSVVWLFPVCRAFG